MRTTAREVFGRVEGRELLGGVKGGKLCGWGWGCWFMVREIEEGKKKRKKRECLVYLPVSFRRAISSCCYFSPALLSLSLFFSFPLSLDPPRCPVAAYYLSPLYLRGPVSVRVTPGWSRGRNGRRRDRDSAGSITMCKCPKFPLRKEQNDSGVLRAVSFSYPYCSSVCMYCAGREEGGKARELGDSLLFVRFSGCRLG